MKFFLMFAFFPVTVLGASNFCEVNLNAKAIKAIPVPEDVNYFIRGAPETGEIGFATNNGNVLLDPKTGKLTKVPGDIDPILTPDGKILSVPQSMLFDPKTKTFSARPRDFKGKQIFQDRVLDCSWTPCKSVDMTAEEVKKLDEPYVIQVMAFYEKGSYEKPVYVDQNANFNYQSLGKLRSNGSVHSYRMIFETQDGIQARDYNYDEKSKQFSIAGPVKPLCDGLKGFLPAQSKSGDEFSAYDAEKGVTHVFSIGKSGYDCAIKETIPGMLGKIDFSPDGKRLAYHVDRLMDNNRIKNIVQNARNDSDMESVVFDRVTKRPAIVAKYSKTNPYYPIFLDNDIIAYIDSTKTATRQEEPQFSIKLTELQKAAEPKCPRCFESGTDEEQIAAFIGAIRDSQCEQKPEHYFKNSIPSFSSLDVSQCQSVIESCDSACMRQIKEKIERVSRRGGFIVDGVPRKTVQKWNVEQVSKLERNDLATFCRTFEEANVSSSKKRGGAR